MKLTALHPLRLIWFAVRRTGLSVLLTDEMFLRLQYRCTMRKRLNLKEPRDFNEKLQWLKLHYRNRLMVTCSDKYAVREHVKDRVGAKYLNDLIGVYADVESIDLNALPDEFVLKATHGSGWNIICPDKSAIDWRRARNKMKLWLQSDFSKNGREWQYRDIPPRIICERYLKDDGGGQLRDYKIFAFNGLCKYIWVDFECSVHQDGISADDPSGVSYSKPTVGAGKVRYRNIYDTHWAFQPHKRILRNNNGAVQLPRPECLQEMLHVASELSKGFPQCRVDLYVVDNKRVMFGELTFTCGNGCNLFIPESFGEEMGTFIDLSGI